MELFANCPYTNFSTDENKAAMAAALKGVKDSFGKVFPVVIAGKNHETNSLLHSYNPANKKEVVGSVHKATEELAQLALDEAWKAFDIWKRVPAEERAEILLKGAKLLRERRLDYAALMVYEAGKNWLEADADVAEAIDFMEFYAREAIKWSKKQTLTQYPGEVNEFVYIPLGVGAVIPPWNFPCAILVGMCCAPIAAGNTVIVKPSSDTPIIGAWFAGLMEEAGLQPGVLNFLPGSGSVVGEYLVNNPKTRFLSFTGSKDVGLGIVEKAAKHQPGQIWIKRVFAEMGGKDAILVDDETDVAAAAVATKISAFGYQGQKCSACSRVIVVESVYDEFVEKLLEASKDIRVGPGENQDNYLGPVINKAAFDKILEYIKLGKSEGELILGGKGNDSDGYFINPTIIKDVAWDARLAQEEVFGPVLAVIKAKDFDDALRIVNSTDYGLTGAIFTNNQEKLNRAKEEFHCGNLYLNRKRTGALVDVQPFGGFNMSGTDAKAGGREHLLLFLQGKSICEKK